MIAGLWRQILVTGFWLVALGTDFPVRCLVAMSESDDLEEMDIDAPLPVAVRQLPRRDLEGEGA